MIREVNFAMVRMRFAFMLYPCLLLAHWIDPGKAASQVLSHKESVIESYFQNAIQIHNWRGSLSFSYHRMYITQIDQQIKNELKYLFDFPLTHPIYQTFPTLFLKSHIQLDWTAHINGAIMDGTQWIVASSNQISNNYPRLQSSQQSAIRELSDVHTRSLKYLYSSDPTTASLGCQILFHPSITYWHCPVNFWYPLPKNIGFPPTIHEVRMQKQGPNNITFLFIPTQLDRHLFEYLKKLSENPKLELTDLTHILIIDAEKNCCLSFSITCTVKGKRKILFSVVNTDINREIEGIPIPATTNITTSQRLFNQEPNEWEVNYFGQFNLLDMYP